MAYTKQVWQDGVTPLDAQHMNHMEDGIEAAYQAAENASGIADKFERGGTYILTPDRIEDGGLLDGSGLPGNDWQRIRTMDYIPMTKGGTVKCSKGFINVWEYDRVTHEYLTDNGAWVTTSETYVVKNDCSIRIMWNTSQVNAETAAANTVLTGAADQGGELKPQYLPEDAVKSIVNSMDFTRRWDNMPSMTVKSISHRGRYGKNIGTMCGISAVVAARKQGYQYVENDLMLTSDGGYIMWHDSSLGRIGTLKDANGYLLYFDAANADYWYDADKGALYTYNYANGEYVASSVNLSTLTQADPYGLSPKELTFDVVRRLDFGTAYGFPGERVPTFAEWVLAAKELGVDIYVDFKNAISDEQAEELVRIVRKYGMLRNATWLNSWSATNALKIRTYDPAARIAIMSNPDASAIETYKTYLSSGEVVFNGQSNGLTAEAAQLALDNGFGLECWYVDYASTVTKEEIFAEIERCVSLGVQRMTIDVYRIEDVFNAKYGLD